MFCPTLLSFLHLCAQETQPLGGLLGAVVECRMEMRNLEHRPECFGETYRKHPHTLAPLNNTGPSVVLPILRSLRWAGGPERFFEHLLAAVPAGDVRTVVDVGANRGSFSLMAAAKGHRVIAFEPLRNNIDAFNRLLETHKSKVTLIEKGVGDKPVVLQMRGNSGGKSKVEGNLAYDVGATIEMAGCDPKRVHCEQIHVTTLDIELANFESIFVMKMDIQGFETNAFRGGTSLLARRAVDFFIIEFDPQLQRMQHGSCEEIMLLLRGAGYVLFEGAMIRKRNGYKAIQQSLGDFHTFAEYVKELKEFGAYTDLVAVKYELVPEAIVKVSGRA
jgi:FkbM family methyltransferase